MVAAVKPVEQTVLGWPNGNCFSACVASILEIPLDTVPAYQCDLADDGWWARWVAWFEEHGYRAVWRLHTKEEPAPRGYAILGAKSPRGQFTHAVVCLDGEIVWDPHPDRHMGVGKWVDWIQLEPLTP